MLIVLGAVLLGVAIGLALGGSLATLADARFRWWPLAIVGLSLQVIEVPALKGQLDHWLALGLLIASYVALLVFVAANIRRPGFALVAVGFVLNLLVISLNGGMPVKANALRRAAGPGYPAAVRRLVQTGGTKHHLARSSDVLIPLSDVVAVGRPVRNVFSIGDLTAMAGVLWVLAAATRGGPGRHRRSRARRRVAGGVDVPEAEPRLPVTQIDDEAARPESLDEWAASPALIRLPAESLPRTEALELERPLEPAPGQTG